MSRLLDLDHLILFHDPVPIGREMHHDFIAEQRADLFHGNLLRLGTVQVHDDRGDDTQAHVQKVHVILSKHTTTQSLVQDGLYNNP